jgi:dipeptidyl aminopeptidase/acylaminoacyl peptidase
MRDLTTTAVLRRLEVDERPADAFAAQLLDALLPKVRATRGPAGLLDLRGRLGGAPRPMLRRAVVIALMAVVLTVAAVALLVLGTPKPRGTLLVFWPAVEVVNGNYGSASAVDPATHREVPLSIRTDNHGIGTLSPSGRFAAVVGDGVTVVDTDTGSGRSHPVQDPTGGFHWAGDAVVAFGGRQPADDGASPSALVVIARTADLADPSGSALITLPGRQIRSLAISPDGASIAIQSFDALAGDTSIGPRLDFIDVATGVVQRTVAGDYFDLLWTPDGDQIIASTERAVTADDVRIDMMLIPSAGGPRRAVPDFAPVLVTLDGFVVGEHRLPDGSSEIWRARFDGSDPVKIGTGLLDADALAPDGHELLFTTWAAGTPPDGDHYGGLADLWRVPVAGGDPTRVAEGVVVSSARWSPDGAWIGYVTAPVVGWANWPAGPEESPLPAVGVCSQGRGCSPEVWAASKVWVVQRDGGDPRLIAEGSLAFDW